jgi:hypothetical protein
MKKEVDFLKQEVEDLGATTTSASSVLALAACAIVSFF